MHSKIKGNIGELKTMSALLELGLPVFTEFGDSSRVDLVTIVNKQAVKIQCKAITSKDGSVSIMATKFGPGYSFRYDENDVDVFSLYVLDRDILMFIPSSTILKYKRGMTIRLDETSNNNKNRVNEYKKYVNFIDSLGACSSTVEHLAFNQVVVGAAPTKPSNGV